MKGHNPTETLPPPKSTDTQRIRPVAPPGSEDTNPHIRIDVFPKNPVAKVEAPPRSVREINPDATYEYQSKTLRNVRRLSDTEVSGTDEWGMRIVLSEDDFRPYTEKKD